VDAGPCPLDFRWISVESLLKQDLVLFCGRHVVEGDSAVVGERGEAPGVTRGPRDRVHRVLVAIKAADFDIRYILLAILVVKLELDPTDR
jgi:hypothetical protein